MKLGKKAPRIDRRTLKLSDYIKVTPALPPPPAEVSWCTDVPSWPMALNDQLGDCVIAAMSHMVQQWTFYVGEKLHQGGTVIIPDSTILTAYEKVGGYNPADPSTDNGCDMLTALKYWRNTGLGGHRIGSFVKVDPTNETEWKTALMLFGNLYVGLALPISAQGQDAWSIVDGGPFGDGSPYSWGGHCVPIMAYSPKSLTCVTWGERKKMSHNFFMDYCDECYAVLSGDWFSSQKIAPNLFDYQQLLTDLAAL